MDLLTRSPLFAYLLYWDRFPLSKFAVPFIKEGKVPSRDPDLVCWEEKKKEIKREKLSCIDALRNTGAFDYVVFQVITLNLKL